MKTLPIILAALAFAILPASHADQISAAKIDLSSISVGVRTGNGGIPPESVLSHGIIDPKGNVVINGKTGEFAIGPNGTVNPGLKVTTTSASVTGINITTNAAASGVAIAATSSGTNESLTIDAKGSGTITLNGTGTGNVIIGSPIALTGAFTVTSNSANALAVGRLGATTPAFNVDASTATSITGFQVKSAAAGGGLALAAIGETNVATTLDAKGSGTLTLNGTATGNIIPGANVVFAANKGITVTAGTSAFDFSGGSGLFKPPTGAATFGGSSNTFTNAITPTGGVAAGAGGFTVSPRNVNAGGTSAVLAADGNNSTPSTTETYCSEIFVPCNMTITGIALFNGSDVTGNVTVGLADSTGAPIAAAKSASTAGSGTDSYQLVPFATPYAAVGPATYYVQVQYSSATARYNTFAVGKHGVQKQTTQTYGTLTSFTPSGTFVTAIGNICGLY